MICCCIIVSAMRPSVPIFLHLFQVVHAIREVGMLESVCDMLLYCSFCNEAFSTNLLKQLMVSTLSSFLHFSCLYSLQ